MSFNTKQLVNNRVLVEGTDVSGTEGQTVIDGTQWAEVQSRKDFNHATEAFDKAVEEFFAPLAEAAEQANKALERPEDSLGYIVLEEQVEGTPANAGQLVKLTKDSQILRLIEEGNSDRLVWVEGDLEILAVLPNTHSNNGSSQVSVSNDGGDDQS
jgi:uncharacterized protein (DUF924 family)